MENEIKTEMSLPDKLELIKIIYGVSYSFLGEILGFGPNQLSLYAKGAVPNKSNELALNIIFTPFGMKSYLDNSSKVLKETRKYKMLYQTVENLCFHIEKQADNFKDQLNQNFLENYGK